jgi:CheY-like chemotaxis protein
VPTALVIDDAPDIRFLVRHTLQRAGYEVIEAGSGPEALDICRKGPVPQVAVLDVQMPEMDGWATLERLRADPASANVPVIMCTVKSSAADRARAWELGCDGFLTKPFSIADLVAEVAAATSQTDEQRRQLRRARHREALSDADA